MKKEIAPWLVVATDTITTNLTANVRRLREAAGLSQETLAAKADLDWKHLQEIESRATNVTLRTLVGLATALGVPTSRLLRAAPAPKRRPPGRPRRKKSNAKG